MAAIRAVALVLVAALVSGPLMVTVCESGCVSDMPTTAATPSCHEAAAPVVGDAALGPLAPDGCEHESAVSTAAVSLLNSTQVAAAFFPSIATFAEPALVRTVSVGIPIQADATATGFTLPLRI